MSQQIINRQLASQHQFMSQPICVYLPAAIERMILLPPAGGTNDLQLAKPARGNVGQSQLWCAHNHYRPARPGKAQRIVESGQVTAAVINPLKATGKILHPKPAPAPSGATDLGNPFIQLSLVG